MKLNKLQKEINKINGDIKISDIKEFWDIPEHWKDKTVTKKEYKEFIDSHFIAEED